MQKTIQIVIALVARRSYSRSIPPTFENKLRCYKKKKKLPGVSTVVLDKDENWVYKGFNDIEVVIATE